MREKLEKTDSQRCQKLADDMPKRKKVKKCLKFADIGIVILEKELAKL